MKYLTHSALLFTFFALVALFDVAYGASCSAPTSERGYCNEHLSRYTYSPHYNYCFYFIYGGCGATENIFSSRAECYYQCVKKQR